MKIFEILFFLFPLFRQVLYRIDLIYSESLEIFYTLSIIKSYKMRTKSENWRSILLMKVVQFLYFHAKYVIPGPHQILSDLLMLPCYENTSVEVQTSC